MNFELGPYARIKGKPAKPHSIQAAFHASPAPNKFFRGGVGSGKSLAGAWELFSNVMSNDEFLCDTGQRAGAYYIAAAPRDALVKAGAWWHLNNILEECRIASGFSLVAKKLTSAPRALKLVTGSEVGFVTLKEADMFAGFNAAGCWYDECELADNPDEGWTALVARLRDERFPAERLRMILTSTPRGYRGMSAMFADKQAANDPRYAFFVAKNKDNPAATDENRDRLTTRMSEREKRQQLDGELEAEQGAVYGMEFDPALSVLNADQWTWRGVREDRRYFVAIDWGGAFHALFIENNPYVMVDGRRMMEPLGGVDVVFHELTMDGVQTEEFLNNVKAHLDMLKIPIDIVDCYCDYNPRDATYTARGRSYFGNRVYAQRVGPDGDKERGINIVRWRLLAADGKRRLFFAARLRESKTDRRLIRCLANYKRVEHKIEGQVVRLGVNQDSPWSHGPDALRAYCWPRYRHYRLVDEDGRAAA